MQATPEFRSLYVSRIMHREGHDAALLLRIALRMVESDAEICKKYSCLLVKILVVYGEMGRQPIRYHFTDFICRVMSRITRLKDEESATKLLQVRITDGRKNMFKVLLD